MKYFIDTEFIEGFQKPLFGKRRHFIDLISIGIVCEDGREYYAISKDFNVKDADQWVKDNVISKLPAREVTFYDSPRMKAESLLYKSNRQIKQDLYNFFGYKPEWTDYGSDIFSNDSDIQIYGYYADYDWVLFCSLFGRMIDLPKGFPMYCRDLKQIYDETEAKIKYFGFSKDSGRIGSSLTLKNQYDFPYQSNEHNALDDAKWNFELYKFLKKL
jgi:hypothetical protein